MRIEVALCLLCASLFAAAPKPEITSITLNNGMKIIVEEDHDIPNVAMYFFFKVGSRNEGPGTTGISHFFEHMMFNGAKKYGPKQFDIEMEKAGGRNNAYTNRDLTVYTDWFPRTTLPLLMEMEADRIKDLSFDPKMIDSERGVVYSERQQRVDNSNFGLLYEHLNSTAYMAHPYMWPVIGWASDIQSWTMEDLQRHYRMGYAPNNCVAVVVGDITPDEVIKLAKQHLEPIPKHDPPAHVRTVEPQQKGERRVSITKPAQLPMQLYSFHIPASPHKDIPALEVLGSILTEGRSSRMYQRLVDGEQVALEVSHYLNWSLDPGQMIFILQPREGIEIGHAEKEFLAELDRAQTGGVSPSELSKAKNQLLTSHYREMKTIGGRANLLGYYEIYRGDYQKVFDTPKELDAVTADDVQRVARRYLRAANRTVATLIPEKAEKEQVSQ
jgi:zinc protease